MANEPATLFGHTTLDLDGNRIQIPKHLSDRLTWLAGAEQISAWLWIISQGRYRLLADEQVQLDPRLESLRCLILTERIIPSSPATEAKSADETAVVAMLFPVQLKSKDRYWKVSFPRELQEFIPPECQRKELSVLISPEGYLEIWYTDVLRRTVLSARNFRQ
jgi:hypothetical protein